MRAANLIGKQFGRWSVTEREPNAPLGWSRWKCRCECGNTKVLVGTVLTQGKSKSCGCLHRETCITRSTKHGHATNGITPTYHSWASMLARCENPKKSDYPRWGGRGIKVCGPWHDFKNFLADMGEKPKGHSLGRINNGKGYGPDNCQWETNKQQARNKRNTRTLEYNGQRHSLAKWAELLDMNYMKLYQRIRAGWPIEKALNPLI